jgi:hypothetical protein
MIRRREDLARLAQGGARWRSIGVAADGLDATQSRRLAGALARGERPCGCIGARIGLAAGLALATMLVAALDGRLGGWVLALFVVPLASALGRWLAIARARYARNKAVRALHAHFSSVAVAQSRVRSNEGVA